MLKPTLLTMTLLAFFAIAEEKAKLPNDLQEQFNIDVPAKSVTLKFCRVKEETDPPVTTDCWIDKYTFNQQGNLTTGENYKESDKKSDKEDKLLSRFVVAFNHEQQPVSQSVFDADGALFKKIIITRKDEGEQKIVERQVFSADNQLEKVVKSIYGKKGNVLAVTIRDVEKKRLTKNTFHYNDNKQMIKKTVYNADNEVEQTLTFAYNSKGLMTHSDSTTYQYKFRDQQKHWHEKYTYLNDGSLRYIQYREIEYDDKAPKE